MDEAASNAMQGVISGDAPPSPPPAPAVPEEPEIVSETLYIQNLNERIKVEGHF
jgi:U2 small nuclear ribonucleoprotein B''